MRENYLDTVGFEHRRTIAKFRCSDHVLEIEKGRHKGTPRHERLCTMCHNGQVEDEKHFLFSCNSFNLLRAKYNFNFTAAQDLFTENNCDIRNIFDGGI